MIKQVPKKIFYRLIGHGPCILLTSGDGQKNNVCTVAWTMPVNDEPALVSIAIASSHYSTKLIKKSCEFVINIPDSSLLAAVKTAGSVSGEKIDKFRKASLTQFKGINVRTPHIKECIAFIECKVIDSSEYSGVTLFIGKVVHCAADDRYFKKMWNEKTKTIHHLGGMVFALTGKRCL